MQFVYLVGKKEHVKPVTIKKILPLLL